jgi:hypothetical protein
MKQLLSCSTPRSLARVIALLFTLGSFPAFAAPPANDNLANATDLGASSSGTRSGSNVEATLEEEEFSFSGSGASVWWKWTPTANQLVAFDTFGSTFDTWLVVYTGATFASLLPLEADDDSGSSLQSRVAFNAEANVTYYIAVTGAITDFDAGTVDTGDITLNWGPLPPGEISVYKETETRTNLEHSVATASTRRTSTQYLIFDSTNARHATVEYWTTKVGATTRKLYSVYVYGYFPYEMIPARAAGTRYWLDTWSNHESFFAEADAGLPEDPADNIPAQGSLSGRCSTYRGLASPLKLNNTLTITVPRVLDGFGQESEHSLFDLERSFSRIRATQRATLDTPLTRNANTVANEFPAQSLENAIVRVIKLLEASGYVDEDSLSDSDS